MPRTPFALLTLLLTLGVSSLSAQDADTYQDSAAGPLHRSAQARWQDIDESVIRYTALVKQRIAAQLRTPLKDRTIYRSESAARVFWDRDYPPVMQVLGARAQYPGREYAVQDEGFNALDDLTIDGAFNPGGDRLILGFIDEDDDPNDPNSGDFWFAHPLAEGADSLYRFRSGDTLTLSLPDGRRLQTIQLDVLPRIADVHRIAGSLWIEPETGALVRAVYRLSDQFNVIRDVPEVQEEDERGEFRLVPGIFKPWTFDMTMVAVDYALWDFEVWLPRSMRLEGEVGAGILKMPASFDLSYAIESVVTENDLEDLDRAAPVTEEVHFETRAEAMAFIAELAARSGVPYRPHGTGENGEPPPSGSRRSRMIVPEDLSTLENSPHLPPPIWEEAPGFASAEELADLFGTLADLPLPPVNGVPWAANWGWQRPDLVRYNRVEGPALGGRFQARLGTFLGPLSFQATGFLGFADLQPKARLSLQRESLRRRITLAAYRDVEEVDERGRFLDFGNSLNALLFGRDDGEYFLTWGGELEITPPSARRQGYRFRLYGERHKAMGVKTDFSLSHVFDGDWTFRTNLQAQRLEEAGAEFTLAPWWGTDPLRAQIGFDLYLQGAATRDVDTRVTSDYGRARLTLRAAVPLTSDWRLGLEAEGGTSWGDLPMERHWVLGGPLTLRGFPAGVAVGSSVGRARVEAAHVFPAWTLSVFGDGGWAGDRRAYDPNDVLWATGVGASLLDGLVRFDVSRGLTGSFRQWRVDLYLDAIL